MLFVVLLFVLVFLYFFCSSSLLTFCFWQAALKLQKRNKRARDVAIVKEDKKVAPKSFTGLLPAGVKENVSYVEAYMRAKDFDFTDGTHMKEITRDGTFPIPCIYCGHFGAMGVLCDGVCACDHYANHGFRKPFWPKQRVICGSCDKERFYNGKWSACVCVARCLEHCERTDGWR